MKTFKLEEDFLSKKEGISSVGTTNLVVERTRKFVQFTDDPIAMEILLLIAKEKGMFVEKMMKETNLSPSKIFNACDNLINVNFIKENPHPEDLNKRFILTFDGQIFVENLRNLFPKVNQFLGERIEFII